MSIKIERFESIFEMVDGDRGKNYPNGDDFSDEGYCLFLNAGNVTDSGWCFDKNMFITEEKDKLLHNGRVRKGELIITTRGTVGNIVLYDDRVPYKNVRINSGMLILRIKDSTILQNEYAYYLLKNPYIKKLINLYCSGSAQPQLPVKDFKKIKVELPNTMVQEKISKVLFQYDLAIENNYKRIKILEQMAENLYKEWFVRFRFPGHEKVEFVTGEPKEWKLTKLEDFISIDRGLSYSSEEIDCDEGNDLINLKNIQAFGGFRIDGTKKYAGKYKEQQIVHRGDLVMGVTDMTQDRRTVGAVALIPITHNTSVISADLIKISSKLNNTYLYCMFKYGGISRYISQFANGANVLHLRPQVVNRVKVFLPTEYLIEAFSGIVRPLIDEIDLLNEKNDNLIKQRDLLLPRLMSGKLVV